MIRTPVESSNLVGVGYDPATTTLEIEFTNGAVYQYFDVPQAVYEALMATDSKGRYLASNIKGVYRYARN